MKKITHISIIGSLVLCCMLFQTGKAAAQSINHKAYSLFIFNFAMFTEFPATDGNKDVIRFAVLGNSNIYDELAQILPGKNINGKKCTVERVNSPDDLKGYDVVFLTALKSGQLDAVLKATAEQPVLVITENDGLIKKGAAISFLITDDHKLSFELNEKALSERKLRVSSKLKGFAYSGKGT